MFFYNKTVKPLTCSLSAYMLTHTNITMNGNQDNYDDEEEDIFIPTMLG